MPQYEVQPGDTLWDIAQKTTGDGNRWREIYDNNKPTIGSDPGLIQPGQVFSIPYDQAAVREGNSMQNGVPTNGGDPYAYPVPGPGGSQRLQNFQRNTPAAPPSYAGSPYGRGAYDNPSSSVPSYSGSSSGATLPDETFPSSAPAGSQRYSPPGLTAGAPPGSIPAPAGYVPQPKYPQGKSLSPQKEVRPTWWPESSAYVPTPNQYNAPTQGPQNYTPQMSAAESFRKLSKQEQMAQQVGEPMRAQMGVTITPPIQQGINSWQDRIRQAQRLGVPDTSPSPQQQPIPANRGFQGQQQPMVQWPMAPRNPQAPQTVTPLAYQGRFQNPDGSPKPVGFGHGYTGQPVTNPVNPYAGQQPAQQARPKAIIVINEDGSQLVYDPATNTWQNR